MSNVLVFSETKFDYQAAHVVIGTPSIDLFACVS